LSTTAQGLFLEQAADCENLGSPFTARVCRLAASELDPARGTVAARISAWLDEPNYDGHAVPLRFTAAAHALVLADAAPKLSAVYPPHHDGCRDADLWAALADAMFSYEKHFHTWLDSPPQTNEVRRASAIFLGLNAIAAETGLPLVLSEIGSSGGLNLALDKFAYTLGDRDFGDQASRLRLCPDWTGDAPMNAGVVVEKAAGCDINPLDVRNQQDRLRLLSYIWADQAERMALTAQAIEFAIQRQPMIERCDAVSFVQRRLETTQSGAAHVVFHSVMWQYLTAHDQAAIAETLAHHGALATERTPLAWLRLEPDGGAPGAGLRLTCWPGGTERLLARGDFHGRWIAMS
jgi:hypothetical protein